MAYTSSLNVKSIGRSMSNLNKSLLKARDSAKSVRTTILESNRSKRKSFSSSLSAFRKRREAARRREREDIVEASTVGGAIQKSRTAVVNSTKGFLGRILDFLGTLLVGWALTNLPNIIKMGEGLMERMKKYFDIFNEFKSGLQDFLITFGDMVGEVGTALQNNDFITVQRSAQKYMGRLQDSFRKMENSVDSVIRQLRADVYELLGIDPPPEEDTGSGADTGADTSGGGSGDPAGIPAAGGNKFSGEAAKIPPEGKALLDAIAGSESGGYNRRYPSKTFSGYDDHPRKRELILSGPNKGLRSDAAGRYQFISTTWDQYKRPGAKFTPEEQDLAAYRLAIAAYGYGEQGLLKALREDPLKVANKLSGTWTSLPGGIEPNNATNGFVNRYNASVKRYRQQQQSRPAPKTIQKTESNKKEYQGGYTQQEIEMLKKENPGFNWGDFLEQNSSSKTTQEFEFASSKMKFSPEIAQFKPRIPTNTLIIREKINQAPQVVTTGGGGSQGPSFPTEVNSTGDLFKQITLTHATV